MKKDSLKKIISKEWRLNNLYKIVNKQGELVKFKPNKAQSIINQSKSNRKLILKARQIGFSTNEIIKQLDHTIFNRNITSCILAHEKDSITKLFRIARRAYDEMPLEIKPDLDRGGGSKYEMCFPKINSRIYCDLESRGDTINWLHISEAAFIQDSSRIKSTMQAVPMHGIITLESTANGIGNFFYELWIDQISNFEKFFFPWYAHDEYVLKTNNEIILSEEEEELIKKAKKIYNINLTNDQIFYRRFKKIEFKHTKSDKRQIAFEQEYPEDDVSCFLTSERSVFNFETIKEFSVKIKNPIKTIGNIVFYKEPDFRSFYVIGADPAEGIGGDFSVAVVMDSKKLEIVAMIRGNWRPYDFAHHIVNMASHFFFQEQIKPMIAVERNNHGHAVILELNEHINYENIYLHKDERLGWKTDLVTRPVMMNTFISAVENNQIILNDKIIFDECISLVNINGKAQASDTKHDDCIMATAIALQVAINEKDLNNLYNNIEDMIL